MLQINGKTFMNLQEAVQWLLDNNALPFQSSANYVANTEIGMGTIVNPSPAKVRIGSLIFFADSKVSTVVGLTENGFICSDQYNDLVDDVVYVSNVALNASGHLIVTLSNGDTIDAGLIKQVTGFSINASQHLIVSYNDGTSTDLGAIFNGNITVSGNLTVTGGISGGAITGSSIIETMSGYTFSMPSAGTNVNLTILYAGVSKTGNKITFALAFKIERTGATSYQSLGGFNMPQSIGSQLVPTTISGSDYVDVQLVAAVENGWTAKNVVISTQKNIYNTTITPALPATSMNDLDLNTEYFMRYEVTFLLSTNLAS